MRAYLSLPNTQVPVFVHETNINDYTQEEAAKIYENFFQWIFKTFSTNESSLRNSLVSRLQLVKNSTVLVTGAGTRSDLPFIVRHMQGVVLSMREYL